MAISKLWNGPEQRPLRIVFSLTIAQLVASGLSRTAIWIYLNGPDFHPLKLLVSTRQDVTVTTVAAAVVCLLVSLTPTRAGAWVLFLYRLFAYIHCTFLAINVPAVHWIGAPITLQWLYLGDLLQSTTPQESVFPILSLRLLLTLISIALSPLWVSALIAALWRRGRTIAVLRPLALLVFVACALFSLSALTTPAPGIDFTNSSSDNPLVVFVGSILNRLPKFPSTVGTHFDPDPVVPATPTSVPATATGGRPNIVVVVMESVGVRAVQSELRQLPTLASLMDAGVTYPNAYASTASTTESLFSLLVSRYPRVDAGVNASTQTSGRFVSLPQRLEQLGYRTGYFGVDTSYRGTGAFLRRMKMDDIYDAAAMHCPSNFNVSSSLSFDSCLFDRVARWTQGRAPFFVMAWTNDTHFPYDAGARGGGLGSEGAYRAALESTDAALGKFIRALRASGRNRNTIVVVLGDHGESFGEHGRRVHSTSIFEEEIRIPLVIYDPVLERSRQDPRLARIIDVTPTILRLAGGAPEPSWKGLDLFSGRAAKRAFMFTEWRGLQVGFREGSTTYILDYDSGRFSRFDLRSDPGEHHPIPLTRPQRQQVEDIVGAWINREER